jgi:hypothetical protein
MEDGRLPSVEYIEDEDDIIFSDRSTAGEQGSADEDEEDIPDMEEELLRDEELEEEELERFRQSLEEEEDYIPDMEEEMLKDEEEDVPDMEEEERKMDEEYEYEKLRRLAAEELRGIDEEEGQGMMMRFDGGRFRDV